MKTISVLSKKLIVFAFVLAVACIISVIAGFFNVSTAPYTSDAAIIMSQEAPPSGDNTNTSCEHSGDCFGDCLIEMLIIFEHSVRHLNPEDISRGNLVLINHNHAFNPDDVTDLIYINDVASGTFRVSGENIMLSNEVIHSLLEMMEAYFDAIGTDAVSVISGFRSLDRQREILDEYISKMGEIEARRWAARPGHSEHHSGLAIDFGFYQDGALRTFLGVGRTAWLTENAHYFGFIHRYPENRFEITQVAHEPWHFRYVGLPHSYFIHELNMVLEEYIDFIKTHDYDAPFMAEFRGFTYEVYFTRDLEVLVPFDTDFYVSGTNTDGFIITIRW